MSPRGRHGVALSQLLGNESPLTEIFWDGERRKNYCSATEIVDDK